MTTTTVWYGRAARTDTAADQLRRQHHDCRPLLPERQDYVACYFDIGAGYPGPETRPGPTPAMLRERVGLPCSGGLAQLLIHAVDPDRRFNRVACWSLARISRRTDVVSYVLDRLIAVEVELLLVPAAGLSVAWAAGGQTGRLASTVALTVLKADHAQRAPARQRVRR